MCQDVWEIRASKFNNLEWAQNGHYLAEFIRSGDFKKTDIVLDVGTGTGIIARSVAPLVKEVIGLDKSEGVLKNSLHCINDGKVHYVVGNILHPAFNGRTFDKITARHVFHHILTNTQTAMNECYRLLKPKGMMLLSEGSPPCAQVKEDYIKIFKLKEDRLTFMEDDLYTLMENAGFKNIQLKTVWLRKMSVRNWLTNSCLTPSIQDEIYRLHVNAPDYFKNAYRMTQRNGDCFIDMKMLIFAGQKVMDKNCADRALFDFSEVADKLGIKWFLAFGTCLGMVRDGGYIDGDTDIDLGIVGDGEKIRELFASLVRSGFKEGKTYLNPGNEMNRHYYKYGTMLDVFFSFRDDIKAFLKTYDKVTYCGRQFNVPSPVSGYLAWEYGNWEKPSSYNARGPGEEIKCLTL